MAAPIKPSSSLRVAVLIGSIRPLSNTSKAARALARELEALGDVEVDLCDPQALGLLVPGLTAHAAAEASLNDTLRARVRACHGIVIVTPEYDGSYSAVAKILVEALGYPSVLAGKPVTVFGVASGRIGAVRAVEHLRAVMFNIGALVLPTSPSIAQVHRCFDDEGSVLDAAARDEMIKAAKELKRYAGLLGAVG